jgi:hypothetical protein
MLVTDVSMDYCKNKTIVPTAVMRIAVIHFRIANVQAVGFLANTIVWAMIAICVMLQQAQTAQVHCK